MDRCSSHTRSLGRDSRSGRSVVVGPENRAGKEEQVTGWLRVAPICVGVGIRIH